jgi:hypothetical protein
VQRIGETLVFLQYGQGLASEGCQVPTCIVDVRLEQLHSLGMVLHHLHGVGGVEFLAGAWAF